jgi:hypothetical protein
MRKPKNAPRRHRMRSRRWRYEMYEWYEPLFARMLEARPEYVTVFRFGPMSVGTFVNSGPASDAFS